MTTTLEPPVLTTPARAPAPIGAVRRSGPVRGFFRRPGWPLRAVFYGFPIFWFCGFGEFAFPIVAVPMIYHLWRTRRTVRVPPFFGVWLALLFWVFAGGLLLGQELPGTLAGSGGYIGWTVRVINLIAATAVLLYVGNLTEKELSARAVIRMMCFLFFVTVLGGLLGVLIGNVEFTSLFELVLPHSVRGNYYVHQLVHPGFAQVEDVLGHTSPRPKAPFAYTNTWGNNLALLVIWFMVAYWARGTHKMKVTAVVVLVIALIPIIYSLNRGVWIGLGIALVFVAFHLAVRGRLGLLASATAIAAVGVVVFAATPLHTVVSERLAHPQSNSIRSSLNNAAFDAAMKSPIVGWGTSRNALGSPSSIAIGKTPSCPTCGNAAIGSTGELWSLLIANGFVGAGLYFGFLLLSAFRYRKDGSPEGIAMRLIIYLAPLFALFYPALPTSLSITFVSLALIWRKHAPEHRALTAYSEAGLG